MSSMLGAGGGDMLLPYQTHDSEMGSNAALTELDKGLRSPRIGEQSEAIVRFPRLLERYPFPVLINTALLKLAEVFRQGSNFLKLCVLRVCQESERHLDKMTSVDELVRRIITVMNSNDPVARALTLRTLGALARILSEKKQVHHKVRASLDSQDAVELEAAIYAAERFSARSRVFSVDICPKLLDMIQGYATPVQIKLKIIPIFEHMHHEAGTALLVRAACLELLPSYPGQDFVILTLQTLTNLAKRTLIHIPDQVGLLLNYLLNDPRRGVQAKVLSDLQSLAASETAHLWTKENIETLVGYSRGLRDEQIAPRVAAFNILISIIEAGGVYQVELASLTASPILELCTAYAYSPQLPVAAAATQLLTQLAVSCHQEAILLPDVDILSEAVQAIEALCLLVSSGAGSQDTAVGGTRHLRRALRCVVLLCQTQPAATGQFVDILGGMLSSGSSQSILAEDYSTTEAVCETLTALGSMKQGVLSLLVSDICNIISSLVPLADQDTGMDIDLDEDKEISSSSSARKRREKEHADRILLLLVTMLLQTMRGYRWLEEAKEAVLTSLKVLDKWSCYRLARSAARFGHHWICRSVYTELKKQVSTESHHYWLEALALVSTAEELVCRGGEDEAAQDRLKGGGQQERLAGALTALHRGISTLTAASTAQRSFNFQIQFLRCRAAVLQVLSQLVSAATSLRTSPPPAIAAALAAQSRDDLQRCGRVTSQLRQVVADLRECGDSWGRLAASSFDADPASLALLRLLQEAMDSLASWLEMVCLKSSLQGSLYAHTEIEFRARPHQEGGAAGSSSTTIEMEGIVSTLQAVAAKFKKLNADPEAKPISHLHTSCIFEAVKILNASPLPYPRYFYQSLQETRVKLAVSPQPRAVGEPVAVNTSQYLAVKVEGVVEIEGVDANKMRKVREVLVQLNSSLQVAKPAEKTEPGSSLEQTAELQNDFFTCQFLVPFPQASLYNLVIEALLIDEDGHRWRIGIKHTLTVKSFEDRNVRTLSRS